MNPFELSGSIDHCPKNFSKAFEEIGDTSVNTESLLASKSRLYSASGNSDKRSQISLYSKSPVPEEEKALNVADLTCTDTFAISKSSEFSLLEESKTVKPPRSAIKEKQTLEKSLKSDQKSENSEKKSENSEKKKKFHCKTCKCLENSHSTIKTLGESESLQLLSKLGSVPKLNKPDFDVLTTPRGTVKPYMSPLFSSALPPSQIFRNRINSHVLSSRLNKQISMPTFGYRN